MRCWQRNIKNFKVKMLKIKSKTSTDDITVRSTRIQYSIMLNFELLIKSVRNNFIKEPQTLYN